MNTSIIKAIIPTGLFSMGVAIGMTLTTHNASAAGGRYLYIQSNDTRDGKNAVLGYTRQDDGTL